MKFILGMILATNFLGYAYADWGKVDYAQADLDIYKLIHLLADKKKEILSAPGKVTNPKLDNMIVNLNLQKDVAHTINTYNLFIEQIKAYGISDEDSDLIDELYEEYTDDLIDLADSYDRFSLAIGPLDHESLKAADIMYDEDSTTLDGAKAFGKYFFKGFAIAPFAIVGTILTLPSAIDNSFFENHAENKKALDEALNAVIQKNNPALGLSE